MAGAFHLLFRLPKSSFGEHNFPYTHDQTHLWNRHLTPREYVAYLYAKYGRHAHVAYKLIHCSYDHLLRWNTAHFIDLWRIMTNPTYRHVIFEDPASHFGTTPQNAMLLDYRPSIAIHHTNFLDILPSTVLPVATRIADWALNRPNVHHILYSESIGRHFARFPNVETLAIHGIHEKFFVRALPTAHSVYFMGKIDDAHKNIRGILHATQRVGEHLHVYGTGVDELMLGEYRHCTHHGTSAHPVRDLAAHKIYISYSWKEVLCTTTMEALAMNKYALLLDCMCNQPFKGMSNAYFFKTDDELVETLRMLRTKPPQKEQHKVRLRWDRANATFYQHLRSLATKVDSL
jgi:hypothetical protein